MRAAIWGFALVGLAGPALAAPCDQFSDPLAFNACLARQGPAARTVDVGATPKQGAVSAGVRRWGRAQGRLVFPHPHGRAEMVFTPRR